MGRFGMFLWCAVFAVPVTIMIVLDGFCSGRELCHAGLMFTLLLYAIGIGVFIMAVLIARLIFRALNASAVARVRTMKTLLLIPLVPGLVVLTLLLGGLLGRLG